jgi:hypothetical protein
MIKFCPTPIHEINSRTLNLAVEAFRNAVAKIGSMLDIRKRV